MADVFELELQDLHEEDQDRAPDSDDDIIEIDEVNRRLFIILKVDGMSLMPNIKSIERRRRRNEQRTFFAFAYCIGVRIHCSKFSKI